MMFSRRDAKRARDRRHDARRRMRQPWRALYATRVWQRLRAEQLRREPFCRMHAARGEKIAASHVDHIRAHRGDPALFFDPANLQSLCSTCHNKVKQSHERSRFVPVGADGWPVERPSN
jgi:5-methylcytosine-specific restriction endonuclease McrA